MKKGRFKKFASAFLACSMLACCTPAVFAVVRDDTDLTDEPVMEYEPGAVLVGTYEASFPKEALEDFDVEEIRCISDHLGDANIWSVTFTEKTYDIVWEAIEALEQNSKVKYAEPSYLMGLTVIDPSTEPTAETPTSDDSEIKATEGTTAAEPTETSASGSADDSEMKYEPGAILVGTYEASFPKEALEAFDVEEIRCISDHLGDANIWSVTFTEKTYDIVWEAIEALEQNSKVKYAEPSYLMDLTVIDPSTEPSTVPVQETTAPKDVNVAVTGDADGDGTLSITDATLIQKYVAKLIGEDKIDCTAANVSGSGSLSITDATMVQKMIAGLL